MFMLCMSSLCRKYSYGQLNKNRIVRPCVYVYMLVKSIEIKVSIVGRSKKDKMLTLLTYMGMCVCI